MFSNNYNAEKQIKEIAKLLWILLGSWTGLSVLGAGIILITNAEDLWWISVIIVVFDIAAAISTLIASNLIWGFGDLLGDVKRIAGGNKNENQFAEEIPEKCIEESTRCVKKEKREFDPEKKEKIQGIAKTVFLRVLIYAGIAVLVLGISIVIVIFIT